MEKDIEKYLGKRVRELGGMSVKFFPMGNDGFPDRIILLPNGVMHFVELKDVGKKPRPLQTRVHKALRELGFSVSVLDSKESVDRFITKLAAEGGGCA